MVAGTLMIGFMGLRYGCLIVSERSGADHAPAFTPQGIKWFRVGLHVGTRRNLKIPAGFG